ncbi:MAG: hypothetical protein WCB46_05440 [Methanoregula sp.]
MVNERGQLYTIEGVAAGLIMLLTAYVVVSSTSVYTPGDAHISDMQLEVVGSDALRMMDIPPNMTVTKSPLQQILENTSSANDYVDGITFGEMFNSIVNNRTSLSKSDRIQFNASYVYRDETDDSIYTHYISSSRFLTGGEHPVRVTKWVIIERNPPSGPIGGPERAVLVEVLLWRD